MPTAEQLAFSISTERRAVHVLLWSDKSDLVRALVAMLAALDDLDVHSLLVSDSDEDIAALRRLVELRAPIGDGEAQTDDDPQSVAKRFWLFFLQQATSTRVGPWLNGWRRPISEPPGSMLVIRHDDFDSFQRCAPDIASFVGARVFDASTMLSVFSSSTYERMSSHLPREIETILNRLPGTAPSNSDTANWIEANTPE